MSDTLFTQPGSDGPWPEPVPGATRASTPERLAAQKEQNERLHRPGFPVIEIFGPVVQGEGPAAGRPCYFVRFGGCDYRCDWCDSMYAVDPAEVRANAIRMTHKEIRGAIEQLDPGPMIVVLSGGNPALHDLKPLVEELQAHGKVVHVETQGSVWKRWLAHVDQLVISPKPPSSKMVNEKHEKQFHNFMEHVYRAPLGYGRAALKIVVGDEVDYAWAAAQHATYPELPFFLSALTPQEVPWDMDPDSWLRLKISESYRWLCERAQADPSMSDAVILPQLHAVAHGAARGV